MNSNASEFYGRQRGYFITQLTGALKIFDQLLNFTNKFEVPTDFRKFGPVTTDEDFFSERGQRIFYDLISRLTAYGISAEDDLIPKRSRRLIQPQVPSGQPLQEVLAPLEVEKRGIMDKLGSLGGSILDVLAGPDLSGLEGPTEAPKDAYDHIIFSYRHGCTMVEHYHSGMARGELAKVRQEIALNCTKLIRRLRRYISEVGVMQTGSQVTQVASA